MPACVPDRPRTARISRVRPVRAETARELEQLAGGDRSVIDELLPKIYDEMRAIAARLFRRADWNSSLAPTAVVHEAYLKLVGTQPEDWQGRSQFLALAANVMREILVDHHRKRIAAKRGGDWKRITLSGAASSLVVEDEIDFIALDESLQMLAKLDERQARVVELRFFAGLSVDEIAGLLQVSRSTVEMDWRHARAWLRRRLGGPR